MPSASARRATQLLLLEPLQLDLLLVELVLQRLELLITLRCRRLLQPLLIELLLLLVQTKLKGAQLLGCRASRLRKGRNRERRSHEDNEALHETYVGMAEANDQCDRPSISAGPRYDKSATIHLRNQEPQVIPRTEPRAWYAMHDTPKRRHPCEFRSKPST